MPSQSGLAALLALAVALLFPLPSYFLERYWFWFSVLGDCLAGETKTWPWRRLASVAALPNGHQVQLFYDFLLTNKLLKGYARQDAARTVAGAGKCIFTVRKYPYPAAERVYKATCFASPYPIRIHLTFSALLSASQERLLCVSICSRAAVKLRLKIKMLQRQRNLCGASQRARDSFRLSKPLCRVQVGQHFCFLAWFMVKQICWRP